MIENILASTLSSGDVVVRDNLGSHKGNDTRAVARPRGRPFHLPAARRPRLNTIEQVFASRKHLIRKAQTRDVEATWREVAQFLDPS